MTSNSTGTVLTGTTVRTISIIVHYVHTDDSVCNSSDLLATAHFCEVWYYVCTGEKERHTQAIKNRNRV